MPPSSSAKPQTNDESIKETLGSVVIAFILAFVFRAYVVEAFVIPTGSMAPTLLGRHVPLTCAQCGYSFAVDAPSSREDAPDLGYDNQALCPMCHYPNVLPRDQRISAGDRILVHKYIYTLTEPRRWDVVVFKAPHQPDINFIKRLVGLPQESLYIFEGNIFTRSDLPGPGVNHAWRIARKTRRPEVQRAVWQPIYHNQYVPLDAGRDSPGRGEHPWAVPWVPDNPDDWDLQGRNGYRHQTDRKGAIRFDFDTSLQGGPGEYAYNQIKRMTLPFEPIEEVRIAAAFEPREPGLAVVLQTTARLDNPQGHPMALMAVVDAQGLASLHAVDPRAGSTRQLQGPVDVGPFAAGRSRFVELWYADQEASLWIDGKRVLVHAFDIPFEVIQLRRPAPAYPDVAVQVAGSPVTLHRLELDRDLYYSSTRIEGTPARGALIKTPGGGISDPVALGPDQFFCLGDNSPMSHDGRYWDKLNPWIALRYFPPAPRNDPNANLGIVPRELLMGRAFFVYFPAPLRLRPEAMGFIPNFGALRFIH